MAELVRQHQITPETSIADELTAGAPAVIWPWMIGKTLEAAYEMRDTDRAEVLLRFTDGTVLQLSCDPGYDEAGVNRTPDNWEVVVYDVTGTEAGTRARQLAPGHWL